MPAIRLCAQPVGGVLALAILLSSSGTVRADIWAASYFDDYVLRLDDETGSTLAGGISASSAGLEQPAGMAVDGTRKHNVSSQETGEILFYDLATGTPLPSPHSGEPDGLFATMPSNGMSAGAPSRMTFGPDGNLYVADFNGPNVRVFDGTTGTYLSDAAALDIQGGGITFGPDDALYVGDFSAANVVRVEEGVQTEFIPANSGGLLSPGGLFFLPNGNLLVVDFIGNQILRFDENGENPEVFAVIPPDIPDTLPTGAFYPSNFPSQIVFDPDGNLLVGVLGLTNPDFGGDDRGALLRYDLDGNLLETIVDGLPPVSDLLWLPSPDAVEGDYDGNGLVEPADYLKWRNDYGKTVAAGGGADGNGDGVVSAADYTVWRNALATAGAGAAPVPAVPEPSTVFLACLALAFLAAARRGGS